MSDTQTPQAGGAERESVFLKVADYVSAAMGRPTNITIWLIAVIAWTLVFALGGPHIASGVWLPGWFTSQGFNFPLNLITTVAELFIGFLVAAATNRVQRANDRLFARMEKMEELLIVEIGKNTELTQQVHDLTTKVSEETALIGEVHRRICTG